MTEDMILLLGGLTGVVVFLYCLIFICIKGKSKNQKLAEKWKLQGCVTVGTLIDSKFTHHGNTDLEGALREDSFKVRYGYEVNGKKHTITLHFTKNYPTTVQVYYDPRNPERSIASSEITESKRVGHGCLITLIATFGAMAIVFNILERLF